MKLKAMIKEFFRKKDEVMVGKFSIGLPFVYGDYNKTAIMVHYHCYENENGKRRVKVINHGRELISPRNKLYNLLKIWRDGNPCYAPMPTYKDIKNGLAIIHYTYKYDSRMR
jgi:hypothetical protein